MADPYLCHRDIINAWPTLSDFAADIGVTYGAAKAMRRRSRIGIEYVDAVVSAAQARGLTGISADLIARLVSARRTASTPSSNSTEQVAS